VTQIHTGLPAGMTVEPVAGHIGADISGVDLSGPLDEATVAGIWAAVLAYQVVFFRGQSLDHAGQVAFARRFGELISRPRPQGGDGFDEFPQVWTISPEADLDAYGLDHEALYRARRVSAIAGWHTDLSTAVNPPAASVLRADQVPSFGGDTQWTSLTAAYAGLSGPIQKLADGLTAEHTFFAGYQMMPADPADAGILAMVNRDPQAAVHPVVRVHPETGQRVLFVNPARTHRIIGMEPPQSRRLLDLFFEQVTRAEYTVRFRWEPGSVAFWDNRATAHLGPGDAGPSGEPRVMHRVSVLGDIPAGPGGFVSQVITGRPLAALPG